MQESHGEMHETVKAAIGIFCLQMNLLSKYIN